MDLPTAFGPPPATGRLRSQPEDFEVEEVLGFQPDGSGTHALLIVEKQGANTAWVAGQLARLAGVSVRDTGYSGLKDRHALTRQAFTLPWPIAAPLDACLAYSGEGFRVVSATRHGRKLRPGSHRANRFRLRIRELSGEPVAIDARLSTLAAAGVPNYFGPQRFGRDGGNLGRVRAWALGGAPPRDRLQRSHLLSAGRSALFNEVLARRVARGDWNRLLPGEAVVLDGRRSFFRAPEIDATLEARCAAMDVHPSGPLPGRGESPVSGEALAVEERALAEQGALLALLQSVGLDHERRSLRLPVMALQWRREQDELRLEFELPRGAFATAVLHELLGNAWDAGEAGED